MQYDTGHIVRNADARQKEARVRVPYMHKSLNQVCNSASFARSLSRYQSFTPMGVFPMGLKSTGQDVRSASLLWRNKISRFCTEPNQNAGVQRQKISFLEFLITQPNVNSILDLILTLVTCLSYTTSSTDDVQYRGSV